VHHIYPEGDWALRQIADDPGHVFFKGYGAQMPAGDWNDPGTKQGIYMIGPGGEYLEGAHAASGSASRLLKRMKAGLKRWEALKKEKGYAASPIPPAAAVAPPEVDAAPMALRVSLRDLPRGKGDRSGRRRTQSDLKGKPWMSFTEWAWNQNWLTIQDPTALVPLGEESQPVPDEVALRIVREALVDNVRGQNRIWKPEDVKLLTLTMVRTRTSPETVEIEYAGEARMEAGEKRYAPRLAGRAVWNVKASNFESFRLVAVGERAGAARFNQRGEDRGAAPMGVLLELHTKGASK
jgi:hypothetical protein